MIYLLTNLTIDFTLREGHSVLADFSDSPLLYEPLLPLREPSQEARSKIELGFKQLSKGFQVQREGRKIFRFECSNFQKEAIRFHIQDQSVKYGLGERFQSSLRIKNGLYSIHNTDRPFIIDDHDSAAQTYGHFPMYLARGADLLYHVVVFFIKGPITFRVDQKHIQGTYFTNTLNFRVGVYVGQSPEQILKQVHWELGPSHIPPFWAMGLHQSRWGYKSSQEQLNVVKKYERFKIPLEGMWSDLDYMYQKQLFTFNNESHKISELRELSRQVHWVPILNPFVSVRNKQAAQFIQRQLLVRTNFTHFTTGEAWPGECYYIDFLNPDVGKFWRQKIRLFHKTVPFSGLWIDMNEPVNFAWKSSSQFDKLKEVNKGQPLQFMTISMAALHHGNISHIDAHSVYGSFMAKQTYQALLPLNRLDQDADSLPFVLSRSASLGSSQYHSHWTGDNMATWDFMRLAVSGNMLLNMFGHQIVGADICGFKGESEDNLCARWLQVGSLYPFARIHKQINSGSPEPYNVGHLSLRSAQNNFRQRSSLIHHIYSEIVYQGGVGTFYRPLFLEYPLDEETFAEATEEEIFMLSDFIISVGVYKENKQTTNIYLPQDYYLLSDIHDDPFLTTARLISEGHYQISLQSTESMPIFVRQGRGLFVGRSGQRLPGFPNFTLLIFMDNRNTSYGKIMGGGNYHSNKWVRRCISEKCHLHFNATLQHRKLHLSVREEGRGGTLQVQRVVVFVRDSKLMGVEIRLEPGQFQIPLMLHSDL